MVKPTVKLTHLDFEIVDQIRFALKSSIEDVVGKKSHLISMRIYVLLISSSFHIKM